MNKTKEPLTKKEKIKKKVKSISLIVSILVVMLFILALIYYSKLDIAVSTGINKYGVIAIFLITIFLESFPQLLSPQAILISIIASDFNISLAVLSVSIGSIIGSIIGFYIGKKYMFEIVDYLITEKKKKKMIKHVDTYGTYFLFLSAITPLPYFPMFFGALSMRWKKFVFFGMAPRIISFFIFGYLGYIF